MSSQPKKRRKEIDYSDVSRARYDSLGLVVILSRGGGLFVPIQAFATPALPEFLFAHISQRLKQK